MRGVIITYQVPNRQLARGTNQGVRCTASSPPVVGQADPVQRSSNDMVYVKDTSGLQMSDRAK